MQNSLDQFLNVFQDPVKSLEILQDRIGEKNLAKINLCAKKISHFRSSLKMPDSDVISSSMILGFLLKAYIDRETLNNVFNDLEQ